MRIGIACYPTYGGSGVVASELGRALQARGHKVHLFSYRVPFKVDGRREGICFHEVGDPKYPLFEHPSYGMALVARLAAVARRDGLDVIHAHYAYPHSLSALMARDLSLPGKVKVVTTLHGTDITLVGRDPSFGPLIRHAIEKSDRVTSVSAWLVERTRELFDVNHPIDVIPNFVDPEAFRPRKRRRSGPPVLMYVSNFRPVKRPLDAVEVFARVSRKMDARLVMVGDGPELEGTRRQVARLRMGRKVSFVAPRRDVGSVISRADALVVTSETESFGLVALEAMACGVPVTATRCGGIEELVLDGSTGYLAPVGDIRGLAEASLRLLQNREDAVRMGEAARRIALERYATPQVVAQYEAVYLEDR